jgi:cell division protein FtsL
MTATTRAPARRATVSPSPARRNPTAAPAAPARPNLRVVAPNTLTRAGRQRRARRLGAVLSTILVIAVFGVVAAHVVLTQRQFRLEALQKHATTEEARYERLRLQVAELEAPDRVVAAARELGMVPPATVTYLASTRSSTGAKGGAKESPSGEWATVKSHLAAAQP